MDADLLLRARAINPVNVGFPCCSAASPFQTQGRPPATLPARKIGPGLGEHAVWCGRTWSVPVVGGGHHAACSIARTFTEMDRPGRPGGAGGPGRAGVSPALPALAASWSSPVQLPGSCGSSVAVNQAGAMAAGGTFTASDGTTHVQVCTSPDGKTWQATDLGPGGNEPHGGPHPAVAVSPTGRAVALWGSSVGCPAACSVHPAGRRPAAGRQLGRAGHPQQRTELGHRRADARHGRRRRRRSPPGSGSTPTPATTRFSRLASGSWGPAQTLSTYVQGDARNLSLAVSPSGSAIVAYATQHDAIWAVSGTIAGGFSAPVFVRSRRLQQELGPEGRAR